MRNSKAFTHKIGNGSGGIDENNAVYQSSPHWILTFVRWAARDTLRTVPTENVDFKDTRGSDPLIVENDCINCSVNVNKSSLTHSMSATLVQTDINYMTDLAPGDFVFVNMLNWSSHARRLVEEIKDNKPLNGVKDGFKGLFKIQSVRKTIQSDPESGVKRVVFNITGFSFTEFNNTIYFQPELVTESEKSNVSLFASNIQANWALLANDKGLTNGQDLMRAIIESFIGDGLSDDARKDKAGIIKSPNTLFFIPKLVGSLLGNTSAVAAKDIYNFLFGIQTYGENSSSLAAGFNPLGINTTEAADTNKKIPSKRFLYTPKSCKGESLLKPEYWNQIKLWSIVQQFTNSPLNELYSSFRVSPTGRVMPTIVYRQIPFTNDDFDAGSIEVTRFMNLPRWHISASSVYSFDIGRDEAARVNFVQYFGRSTLSNGKWGTSEETAAKNYLFDIEDVKRSGLRPYVISGNFDITDKNKEYESPKWAKIMGDALIGGHLKLNGTIECTGIVEPIAVGDNLEFDDVVYHIEEVAHSCSQDASGLRRFRTKISLSSGLSVHSGSPGTKYAEFTNSAAQTQREKDFKNNGLEPGVSESQDTNSRPGNIDISKAVNAPFAQPNAGASVNNSVRKDLDTPEKGDKE